MNIVIMMGRLTRDPEVRYSQGSTATAIANISLAVDRRMKREGQPDADFFNGFVAFGKTAEFIEKYLHKGSKVVVQAHLQNDNYQGKDGQMVYRDRFYIDSIEFAESRAASQANNQGSQPSNNQGRSRQQSQTRQDDFMNIPDGIDEELPFN